MDQSPYEHHRANPSVSQGRSKDYGYVHYSSNHYVHKSLLTLTPLMWNEMDWLLCHPSRMELAEWWTLCHPFRCGWWRKRTNLFCRVRSPDVLNRLKNLLEAWNCLKGRRLIMKKWTLISHVLILFYLFYWLMRLIWWIDVIFFTDEVYEFVSCTNSSAGWSTQSHWVGPR